MRWGKTKWHRNIGWEKKISGRGDEQGVYAWYGTASDTHKRKWNRDGQRGYIKLAVRCDWKLQGLKEA